MDGKIDRIRGCLEDAAGAAADDDNLKKEISEREMDKIESSFAAPTTSRQGAMIRMGRKRKRRGGRITESVKLVLLPCLCDWNERTTGGRAVHSR